MCYFTLGSSYLERKGTKGLISAVFEGEEERQKCCVANPAERPRGWGSIAAAEAGLMEGNRGLQAVQCHSSAQDAKCSWERPAVCEC